MSLTVNPNSDHYLQQDQQGTLQKYRKQEKKQRRENVQRRKEREILGTSKMTDSEEIWYFKVRNKVRMICTFELF